MIELTVSHAIANRLKADVGIETLTFAGDLDRMSRQAQRLANRTLNHLNSMVWRILFCVFNMRSSCFEFCEFRAYTLGPFGHDFLTAFRRLTSGRRAFIHGQVANLRAYGFILMVRLRKGGAVPEEEAMLSLLKEIIKSGEITVSFKQVTAKGGLAIVLAFFLVVILVLKL